MTHSDSDWVEEVVALDGLDLVVRHPSDAEALIEAEAFERDEALPYWAELWPSGVALARRLHGRALRGTRVLELGCGLALPSIVAALGGGKPLATDWSADALEAARLNAEANGARIETLEVDWREPGVLLERGPFGLVLAADVLYERRNLAPLLALLEALSAPVLLADPGRATAEPFLAKATATFAVTSHEDPVHPQVRVYELRPTSATR